LANRTTEPASQLAVSRWVRACSTDGNARRLERTLCERSCLEHVEVLGAELLERLSAHSSGEESCQEGIAGADGADDVDRWGGQLLEACTDTEEGTGASEGNGYEDDSHSTT
jgi:hypothetical protein